MSRLKKTFFSAALILLVVLGFIFWQNSGAISYTTVINPDSADHHTFTVSIVCTNDTHKNALATMYVECSHDTNIYSQSFPLGVIPAGSYISKDFSIDVYNTWKPSIQPGSDGYTEDLIQDFLNQSNAFEKSLKRLNSEDFSVTVECSPSSIRVIQAA